MGLRTRLLMAGLLAASATATATAQIGSPLPRSVPTGVGGVEVPKFQTPPATPAPPSPLPGDKPPAGSSNPLVPPMPSMAPPSGAAVLGCASCADSPAACGSSLGCDGLPIRTGPRYAVELDYTHGLFWTQPKESSFPIATINGRTVLDGTDNQGLMNVFGFNLKMWLDHEHRFGLGGGGFMSENRSRFDAVSGGPGGSTIQRPFFDAVTGLNSSLLVSDGSTNGFLGSIATRNAIRFAGADLHFRRNVHTSDSCRVDLFAGFRYYDLNESYTIDQSTRIGSQVVSVGGQPNLPTGSTVQLRDRSYSRNQFYGGEVGMFAHLSHGIFFGSMTPRLAFGPYHQVSRIEGETTSTVAGQNTVAGGLLAAGTAPANGNLGREIENRMGIAVNLAAQGGINLTEQLSLAVGYQFIYLGDVVRPITQFDPVINPRVIPVSNTFGASSGPIAPRNRMVRDSFYAHGATITLQLAY